MTSSLSFGRASRLPAARFSAIFLDRDGVINENRADHVKSWAEFRFIPGSLDAIARLSRAGIRVFIVSNQAIINRGLVCAAEVDAINRAMVREIEAAGGQVCAVAYCPHRPDEGCPCRKPKPGLLLELARVYAIDLHDSLLIGDALTDIEAARAAGCEAALVLTGRGADQLQRANSIGLRDLPVAQNLGCVADALVGILKAQPNLNRRLRGELAGVVFNECGSPGGRNA